MDSVQQAVETSLEDDVERQRQIAPGRQLHQLEQAAVEDGVTAYENLLSKLTDVPTPAGPTPQQIGAELVQVTSVRRVQQL